ncbi:MAG: A/G-specific adenine glycosylase [Gammaproteobacteria bacterium]|nr:MAG: A/G-specific adenine glycosylase [Gammaproteobacteria bacterium]
MAAHHEPMARALLNWFDQQGRHDLPWQQPVTPYGVWVSEIMLQQTQVSTVVPYYLRFMERFTDVCVLARAPVDEVLHAWAGLGYYTRARNLHRAAQIVSDQHNGVLPATMKALVELPGIGRSTAAAILALVHGQRQAILDGNVKRVLARLFVVPGWPGEPRVMARLWQQAEAMTPGFRVAAYTQAIMDLGATLCTRTRPGCPDCPLKTRCLAFQTGRIAKFPAPKPNKRLPVKQTCMLIVRDLEDRVLLLRRPPAGIWGGLWSLPECSDVRHAVSYCTSKLGLRVERETVWCMFRHRFTHFGLEITPILVRVMPIANKHRVPDEWLWHDPAQPLSIGVAKPVSDLLQRLMSAEAI